MGTNLPRERYINSDKVNIHNNDTFMFQSHIAGDWNDNIWNKKNYKNFKNILQFLSKEYELEYKTLGEL